MKTILFIYLIFTIPAFCQNIESLELQIKEPGYALGIKTGIYDYHFRDEFLSPHIFSSIMFTSEIFFQLKTKQYAHNINFIYSHGHPDSKILPRDIVVEIISLSYSATRTVAKKKVGGNPLNLSLGVGVSALLVNTYFVGSDKNSSYEWEEWSWYSSNSLNLLFQSHYQFDGKKNVYFQFTVPVVLLVARPENGHLYNDENLKVIDNIFNAENQSKTEYIGKNTVLFFDLGYIQPLNNYSNLRLNYIFNYASSDRPKPLHMYMNQFMIGFDFVF